MNYAALIPLNEKKQPNRFDLDILDTLENASTVTKRIGFVVTCIVNEGRVAFFARLKGGKRFTCSPVMPKSADGRILAPGHGRSGYLTIKLSSETRVILLGDTYEFNERPDFIHFEPVESSGDSKGKM